jgi:hypothetical protein
MTDDSNSFEYYFQVSLWAVSNMLHFVLVKKQKLVCWVTGRWKVFITDEEIGKQHREFGQISVAEHIFYMTLSPLMFYAAFHTDC